MASDEQAGTGLLGLPRLRKVAPCDDGSSGSPSSARSAHHGCADRAAARASAAAAAACSAAPPLSPVSQMFLGMGEQAPDIYAILRLRGHASLDEIAPAMRQLVDAHERFRLRVAFRAGAWRTEVLEEFDVRWCMREVTLPGPDVDVAFNTFVAGLMSGAPLAEGHLPPWDCSVVHYASAPRVTDVLLRCSHMIGDGQLFMQLLKDVLEEVDDGPGSEVGGSEVGGLSSEGASEGALSSPSSSSSSLSGLVGGGAAGAAGGAAPPAVRPSQEELDAAIRLADGPAQERVEAVFAERHYVDGEVLVAPGDAADTVFLIAAGEVEIVAAALLGGMGAGAHEPLITGLDLDGIGGQDGGVGVGDLLEADQGLASRIEGGGSPRGRASVALIGEVLTAGGGRPRGGAPGGARLEDGRQTLGLKGPGDSLGLPSLLQSRSKEHRWRAFCRARGAVTVFAARVCDLQALVAQHPEMEPAVQQIATQQETDMAVAEAMRRLRIFQGGGGGGKASGAVTVHATSVVPPQAS